MGVPNSEILYSISTLDNDSGNVYKSCEITGTFSELHPFWWNITSLFQEQKSSNWYQMKAFKKVFQDTIFIVILDWNSDIHTVLIIFYSL